MSNEQPDANKEMLQALRDWAKKYGARIEVFGEDTIRIMRMNGVGYYPHWLCYGVGEETTFERVELEEI